MLKDIWKRLYEEAAEGGEGGGGTAAVEDPNVAAMADLQKQIDTLKGEAANEKKRADEQQNAAMYWHDEAKKGKTATEKKTPAAAADPADDLDPLEALSKGGVAALDKILEARGFVKADAVTATVTEARQNLVQEAELAEKYPDIKKPDSEFFKTTAKYYAELIADGVRPGTAMKSAAKAAQLEMIESGKTLTVAQTTERAERAAAAGGDTSRGKGGKAAVEEEDGEPDEKMLTMWRRMCPDGVNEADFIKSCTKRAKAGVVYSKQ